jgi:hypothetical protein
MNSEAIRTQGDGIEHSSQDNSETTRKKSQESVRRLQVNETGGVIEKLGKEYLLKQTTSSILFDPSNIHKSPSNFPAATVPKGKKFFLIPKLVNAGEPRSGLKNRKLNLILMEPYRVILR